MDYGEQVHESHDNDGIRADGSLYSPDVDREAFAAEAWGCRQFGKEPDQKTLGKGDPGYDMLLKVDFKHLGILPDGSPRREGHLIVNKGKVTADRYVAISGSKNLGFRFEGWCTRDELLIQPMVNFGYGEKHAIQTSKLRKFGNLYETAPAATEPVCFVYHEYEQSVFDLGY